MSIYKKFGPFVLRPQKFRTLIHRILVLLLVLPLAGCGACDWSMAEEGSPTPRFRVLPGDAVISGEEVFFDASNSRDDDLMRCRFVWDFGDGIASATEGITATHVYTRPGTYVITLSVTNPAHKSASTSASITVAGIPPELAPRPADQPLLKLKFTDTIDDTSGYDRITSCPGGTPDFADGIEGRALDMAGGKHIRVADAGSMNGINGFTISFWARKHSAVSSGCFVSKMSGTLNELKVFNQSGEHFGVLLRTVNGSYSAFSWTGGVRITNTDWHHYAVTYDGSRIRLFIDGAEYTGNEQYNSPLPCTGSLSFASTDLYIGRTAAGTEAFDGLIDELRVFNRALAPRELFVGFELWHADFHGHTAQYIYVQIPGDRTATSSTTIAASLAGPTAATLSTSVGILQLVNKAGYNNLQPVERILLRNSSLDSGDYVLTVQLYAGATLLDEIRERFTKPHSGNPVVGINENNAICINGTPFFPVTAWGLNAIDFTTWTTPARRINALYHQGFYPTARTPSSWIDYLDHCDVFGMRVIGPGEWDGRGPDGYGRNSDINRMMEYIEASQNHQGIFMWMWGDEPDLGRPNHVPATVIRGQTYQCHRLDGNHLVATNFAGFEWCDTSVWLSEMYHRQQYVHSGYTNSNGITNQYGNRNYFGRRTHVVDVYGFDYYPVDWGTPHSRGATFARLAAGLDKLRAEIGDMAPFMSFVETADIRETPYATPWAPTAAQLKMIIWLNVVHGVKGINWFHYFGVTPEENYQVMTEFVDWMTDSMPGLPDGLSPVVLEAEPSITVTAAPDEGRIDTMVRQYGGRTFLFAVRISEMVPNTGNSVPISSPGVVFTFSSNIADPDSSANVLYEGRSCAFNGTVVTDSFAPNAVHVYEIGN